MSKITLSHENKQYVLEYNRQSVKIIENNGFRLDEVTSKPVTMIPLLFYGAFLKNCKGIKRNVVEKIYDAIPDKEQFVEILMEMYSETVGSLMEDNGEGNVTWTVEK